MRITARAVVALFIFLVAFITVVLSVYGWFLGQSIYESTYTTKAGISYWTTWTLDLNIFNASLLLAVLSMLSMVVTPQHSTLLSLLTEMSPTGPRLHRLGPRSAAIWRFLQFLGFFGYYVAVGGRALTGQNVAFLMMLLGSGSISLSADDVGVLFQLPFSPGTTVESVIALIPAMEAYQFYLALVMTIIIVPIGRLFLSLLRELFKRTRDMFVVLSKAFLIGALVMLTQILAVPMWTVNAGTYLSFFSYIVSMNTFIGGAAIFALLRIRSGDAQQRLRSKIAQFEEDLARLQGELLSIRQEYESGALNPEDYRTRVANLMQDRTNIGEELRRLKIERMFPLAGSKRRFSALTIILVGSFVMIPIIQGVTYGIPMEGDKYIEWKFNYETIKEIETTNWAADLQDLQLRTLEDLTSNATPETEVEFLNTVRQWDQRASFLRMKNQIGKNWMKLADSDIVYLKNNEYWIAPLTFDRNQTTTSFINRHIIFTHTQAPLVLDAFSGDFVQDGDLIALFNRTEELLFYYGEGFRDIVFVNVPGFNEVENATYSGAPDHTLTGFESTFYLLTMGPSAWSFIGQDMDMLVERDVTSRVQRIMLPGLSVDDDPYLVVDSNGNMFYAVSIYIDYKLATGYAHENYMRFLGVALVDIADGEMTFYSSLDPEEGFFIDQLYLDYYPWEATPSWLQSQMRYPEDLYERQLEISYIYHVRDGLQWQSGTDFFISPRDSDTRYIIMRIGGEERFVAMHNAEFKDAESENLAGVYVMGCGDRDFGQLEFYSVGNQTVLGPSVARQALETNDEVRTQLQLWGKHRFGNRLLYHLGGDIFFVIPIFLEVQTSGTIVIEKLGGVGLVDALRGERVELGSSIVESYFQMFGLSNQTGVGTGEVGFEAVSFSPSTIEEGDLTSLVTLMRNNDNESHHLYLDIVVVTGNFSVFWHGSEVTPTVNPTNSTYTLDIGDLGPGDLYGTTPQLTAYLPAGVVLAQYVVIISLRTEEGVAEEVSLLLTIR